MTTSKWLNLHAPERPNGCSDAVVVWDDPDPATDAYLHAAILLEIGLIHAHQDCGG